MADEMKISAETSTPQASNPPPSQRQPTGRKLPFEMGKKIKVIPETRKGQLNVEFLSTIPGVLKVAEVVGQINYMFSEENLIARSNLKFKTRFV